MVLLPVVERELRVVARGRAMYRIRFWAALVVAGVFAWGMKSLSYYQNLGDQGLEILSYLTLCAFVFAALIGVVATSDSVSREKREGTLGLLFLTDLKGYDVVCGKMAANSVNALYALVATFPVLGMPLLMGGVTFVQFSKLVLTLLSTMVLSLSVGTFVSTFSRNERKAMVITFFFVTILTCLPFFLTLWLADQHHFATADLWMGLWLSPGFGIMQTMARGTGWPVLSYWLSVGWQWLVSAGLIAIACAHIPNSWEEKSVKKPPVNSPSGSKIRAASRKEKNRAWLEKNPFFWLALQGEEPSRGRVWMFVVSMLTIWVVAVGKFGMNLAADQNLMAFELFIVNTPLKIWIAAEACRRFSEDRSNNAFELLLSTPLSSRQIVGGQWLALRQQFGGPLVVAVGWELVLAIYHYRQPHWWEGGGSSDWPQILLMVTDCVALASAGMWFGLRLHGRIRALLASLTLVLLAPAGIAFLMIGSMEHSSFRYNLGQDYWSLGWGMAAACRAFMVDPVIIGCTLPALLRSFRQLAARR